GHLRRCRSSVVEHSLGKGEVVSSILTGSTRKMAIFLRVFARALTDAIPQFAAERDANMTLSAVRNPYALFLDCSQILVLQATSWSARPDTVSRRSASRAIAGIGRENAHWTVPHGHPDDCPARSDRCDRGVDDRHCPGTSGYEPSRKPYG